MTPKDIAVLAKEDKGSREFVESFLENQTTEFCMEFQKEYIYYNYFTPEQLQENIQNSISILERKDGKTLYLCNEKMHYLIMLVENGELDCLMTIVKTLQGENVEVSLRLVMKHDDIQNNSREDNLFMFNELSKLTNRHGRLKSYTDKTKTYKDYKEEVK